MDAARSFTGSLATEQLSHEVSGFNSVPTVLGGIGANHDGQAEALYIRSLRYSAF